MRNREKTKTAELNTSSVADIAFLLLSFFLMTTVISDDKGLTLTLPEWRDVPIDVPVAERNVFNVNLNSQNQAMVEGEPVESIAGLRLRVRDFVLNNGADRHLSESPKDAIISLKTDRGTSHQAFMAALDEIQAAYHEIYAERAGMSVKDYLTLDPRSPSGKAIIDKAKAGVPMNISIAEPSRVLDE